MKSIHEYRLDRASQSYPLTVVREDTLVLENPFPVTVAFSDIDG